MTGHLLLTRSLCIGILASCLVDTAASQSLKGILKRNRVDADPNKTYSLVENNGPWVIMAAAFAGDGAEQDARKLVLELRQNGMRAYQHKKEFDHEETIFGLGLDADGNRRRMRPQRATAFDEYAVLVGDFPSVDDAGLQKTLKKIKHAKPKCLELKKGSDTTLRFAGLRYIQKRINGDQEKKAKGPMGNAFVTRNPLLPKEYFSPQGIDRVVLRMNTGVKYSLLDCPAKYTVRVASFRGQVIIDQKKIDDLKDKKRVTSRLHSAAENANRLTLALRGQGVEAYEFHDRHESIVTVGSFESVGSPRIDGKTEIDPAILRIIQAYGAKEQPLARGMSGLVPRTLGGIPFDARPTPVQVPRRSIAADYARAGRWSLN